jgi:signal peptidase I
VKTEHSQPESSVKETIKTVVYAVILALIFRSFLFEPFHIPSGSMRANLLVGDYLFVSKYQYGYSRYSFPFGLNLFEDRIFEVSDPQRGEVVVFRKPGDESVDFIKRVIGLPGDRVQMRDGVLYLNGEAIPKEPVEDFRFTDSFLQSELSIAQYRETLPGGKSYKVLDETTYGVVDNTREFAVPEGHYFVMGDNRDNSTDSRYFDNVGFIPKQNLVGRAEIVVLSFASDYMPRWDRFFTWIR